MGSFDSPQLRDEGLQDVGCGVKAERSVSFPEGVTYDALYDAVQTLTSETPVAVAPNVALRDVPVQTHHILQLALVAGKVHDHIQRCRDALSTSEVE